MRSGWWRGSIYWVLLFRDRFAVSKPLSQIQRSTLSPLQDADPTPSFGGFGLQLNIGASVFAGNPSHRLNVLVGAGSNGKTVFLNAISAALGDYAGTAPALAFTGRGDHPTALAGIAKTRFCTAAEVRGMWREGSILAWTGGDKVSIRFMRQDYFQVEPECTFWIMTNNPPTPKMVDEAMKRRIRIWVFGNKVKEEDKDLDVID